MTRRGLGFGAGANSQSPLLKLGWALSLSLVSLALSLALLGGWSPTPATAAPLSAIFTINTDIATNTTWTTGNTYVIAVPEVEVLSGATLTVEPGVVISFTANSQLVIRTGGRLEAVGSPAQPIDFSGSPGACTWQGVWLRQSNSNTIRYATFRYAARAIHIDDGDFQDIQFNTFQNNGGCGAALDPLSGAISGLTDSSLISHNVFTANNTALYLSRSGGNTIANNLISGTTVSAIFFDESAVTSSNNNQILSNTIRYAGGFGLTLIRGVNNQASANRISDSGGGIRLDDQTATVGQDLIIRSNDIFSNTGPGLLITDTATISLSQNLIWANSQGVRWGLANFTPGGSQLGGNVICRNSAYLFRNEAASSLTAAPNWWGANSPTTGAAGSGADIEGPVTIAPAMVLTATAPVAALPADGVATTTLTLSLNGGGQTVPARARDLSLSATTGQLSANQLTLDSSGQATLVYTSGLTAGPVTIQVTDLCATTLLTLNLQSAPIELALTKTSAQSQVEPGQWLTYTLSYTNNAAVPASSVVLTDLLPSGTLWLSDTAASQGFTRTGTTPQVSWTLPSLAAGAGGSFELVAQLPALAVGSCGQTLVNSAAITAAAPDSDPGNNTASHSAGITVICPPDLALTKTLLSPAPSLGKATTFGLAYRNTGSLFTATNTVITDFLAADVTYLSDTLGLSPTSTSPNVVWPIGTLPPGAGGSFTLDLGVTASPADCVGGVYSFTNQAALGADEATANSGSISSGSIPCDNVDLAIAKADGVGPGQARLQARAGELVTYTLTISNYGGQIATGVVVTETLPAGASFAGPGGPTGWSQVGSSAVYTYALGSLPAFAGGVPGSASLEFVLQVAPDLPCTVTDLTNTASVGSAGPEADPTDNSAAAQTPVTCSPLQVSKSTAAVCAVPGQLIDYTITVTNGNPGLATGLSLSEALPAHTLFQGPAGVWTPAGSGVYTHNLASLAAGASSQTGFWVQVDPATPAGVTAITNVVTLNPLGLSVSLVTPLEQDAPDLYVIKNDNIELLGTATTAQLTRLEQKVGTTPWLDRVKAAGLSAQATSAAPGDIISYTLGYGNAGGGAATNVVITETLPANTSFAGPLYWTHLGGNTYRYSLASLAAGSGGNLEFRVRIDSPFPTGTSGVTNTVQIGSDALLECDPSDNLSQEYTAVAERQPPTGADLLYLPLILKANQVVVPTPTPGPTSTPRPTPTPLPLAHVSDVAVDPVTNQVFVAGPRQDAVHVIAGSSDTYAAAVPVGNGPTGLAVLTSTTPSKVFVAHLYANNNWTPGIWIIDADTRAVRPMTHAAGYVGAAPVKAAANPNPGWERVYISNYFDRLPALYGPTETRVGWVEKKNFQASYGLAASPRTNLVYLASIDTGELIIFDGSAAEANPDYGACHHAPPLPRQLRMVATNPATGDVFVTSPPDQNVGQTDSRLLVLSETALLQATGGPPSDQTCAWNFINGQLAPLAVPGPAWVANLSLPGAVSAGEEGLAVNPATGRVYITDGPADKLFIIAYDSAGHNALSITSVPVGDNPQGVAVNPLTNKVYVGNAHSITDPYGTVTVVDGATNTVIKTIPLTP